MKGDIKKLEQIAPRIKQRHEEYKERRGRQLEALKALECKHKSLPQELDGVSLHDRAARRTSYGERPALDARNLDNHSLAARLAQREVRRRDTQRRSVRQAGVSEEEEQERKTGGVWGTWDDEYAQQGPSGDDLSRQIQEVARLQREGQRTSYAQVCMITASSEWALLTVTASAIAVVDISIQLPLCTPHICTRQMGPIQLATLVITSSTAERTDLQNLRHAPHSPTAPSEATHPFAVRHLRAIPATSCTRKVHFWRPSSASQICR